MALEFPIELDLEMLIFEEGVKPKNPEKNPRSKGENQQQTQPTYDAGCGNRGGRRALSPLRQPCSPVTVTATL